MHSRHTFFNSIYTKILFAAIVGGVALAGGMYFGGRLSTKHEVEAALATRPAKDIPRMILGDGELFPLEPVTDLQGRPDNFESILKDHEAVILFITLDCGRCLDLAKFWREVATSRMRPEVLQIIALPSSVESIPPEYRGLFANLRVVRYDDTRWSAIYHLVFSPVIVGVDQSGFITHLQYGFEDAIDHDLVERFFRSR